MVSRKSLEFLESHKKRNLQKIQIFATDLDGGAIEHARKGIYFENIASEISPERLERFFVKQNSCYVVKKELREMIVFAQHNLIKDAPFTRLDLLCCRNVMIYLNTELQKKIIPVFHYALLEKGLLFLGPAESVINFNQVFNIVDSKWKIFERNEGTPALGQMIDFPFHINHHTTRPENKEVTPKPGLKNPVIETFNKILVENYTPASLLLNDKGDILYINGKTSKYITLYPGEAVMNIHRMAREELKYALGNAMHQTLQNKSRVEINDIKLKDDTGVNLVGFCVDYLNDRPLEGYLLVTFKDQGALKPKRRSSKNDPSRNIVVDELEKELIYTKQQLHTTIEQMETSMEELKSTNEELQSTNEELQSTNEEALTTKEEMQSLNEELMTINLQYQIKAEELTAYSPFDSVNNEDDAFTNPLAADSAMMQAAGTVEVTD
ncbi:MAG: chemotaxis protein CheR, partial [Chryseobacterium sp.]